MYVVDWTHYGGRQDADAQCNGEEEGHEDALVTLALSQSSGHTGLIPGPDGTQEVCQRPIVRISAKLETARGGGVQDISEEAIEGTWVQSIDGSVSSSVAHRRRILRVS